LAAVVEVETLLAHPAVVAVVVLVALAEAPDQEPPDRATQAEIT